MHHRLPVFYGLKVRIKEKLIIVDAFDYLRQGVVWSFLETYILRKTCPRLDINYFEAGKIRPVKSVQENTI